jgi:hypothetical protein
LRDHVRGLAHGVEAWLDEPVTERQNTVGIGTGASPTLVLCANHRRIIPASLAAGLWMLLGGRHPYLENPFEREARAAGRMPGPFRQPPRPHAQARG